MPPLHFDHGELSVNQPMPYLVYNTQRDVVGIIDTTDTFHLSNARVYPHLIWVLDKHHWHYGLPLPASALSYGNKKFHVKWLSQSFPAQLSGPFNASVWLSSISQGKLSWLVTLLYYPMIWLYFVAQTGVFLFFLASLGRLFARVMVKQALSFAQSFRIMTLAATPTVFTLVVLVSLQQFKPGSELFLTGMLALYYTLAVISLKHSSRLLVLA
jgi:hypothetical protein